MVDNKHLAILDQGVAAWNAWRRGNPEFHPDLVKADLSGADLSGANLSGMNLTRASLIWANLRGADLISANLSGANLSRTNLIEANLSGANLSSADLSGANLSGANLSSADLSGVVLSGAALTRAALFETNLAYATIGWSTLGDVNLTATKGLDTVRHIGPSTIGIDVIRQSKGQIPHEFLRGCGMLPWEIELARLYDPNLTPGQIADILDRDIFAKRTDGPLYLGGIFISYSHANSKFVDKLHKQLIDSGANVWLDRHDMLAGDMEKQVYRAIRINDIVVVVLSQDSVESDWVEHELEIARKKEKEEHRDVLCPVALDGSWEQKVEADVLWRQLKKKHILDFSRWETEEFSPQFKKLLNGLKLYYKRKMVSHPIAKE